MADAAVDLERSDATSYSPILSTDRGTAERIARPSAPSGDGNDGSPSELASLVRLGAMKLDQGNEAEAEESFRKALEIVDRTAGSEHPDLILLLNDLTRIYLKQSAFAAAEPLLLRLLELKRSKGEDHPEVGTVLASLAGVRQALGRHESAEQLWRRVLEIRERTLAPNHFAIATALEHFGEACSARGKIREALAAFQRAHTIRERTLGSDHSSLRSSRERIADLQLQASDVSIEPSGAPAAPSAPDRFRLLSGEPVALTVPGALVRERVQPQPPTRKATVVIQGQFADSAASEAADAAPAALDPILTMEPMGLQTEAAPYRSALESMRDELETDTSPYNPDPTESFSTRARAKFAPVISRLGKREMVAATVVVAIASLGIAAATGARSFGEVDQTTAAAAALPTQSVPVATSPEATTTTANLAGISVAASTLAVSKPAQHPRVAEERIVPKKVVAEQKPETKKLAIPSISSGMLSRLDSVASRAATSGAPISFQPAPTSFSNQRASFEATAADQSAGPQRARLIGDLPSPRVPPEAVDIEGRPVMTTMSVVNSPNALLTTAVKKVIPSIRFEPARTGGSDSRVVGDVVEIGFRFARQQR
jgi:tetratricopeptide (TPR) repeat protein